MSRTGPDTDETWPPGPPPGADGPAAGDEPPDEPTDEMPPAASSDPDATAVMPLPARAPAPGPAPGGDETVLLPPGASPVPEDEPTAVLDASTLLPPPPPAPVIDERLLAPPADETTAVLDASTLLPPPPPAPVIDERLLAPPAPEPPARRPPPPPPPSDGERVVLHTAASPATPEPVDPPAPPPPPAADDGTGLAAAPDGPAPAPTATATGRSLVKSSGIVAAGTVLSRITGLLRTVLTGAVLGAVGIGAAYNLANNTPNMIYDLLLGGILSATLVPVLVSNRERGDEDGTAAVLSVATAVLVAVTVLAVVFAPLIIDLYGRLASFGAGPPSVDEHELAVALLRLFAPQVLFYGLTTLGSAYLNAHGRFAAAAVAPVINNVWMILILLAAMAALGERTIGQVRKDPLLVWLLGAGTTVGILAMALVLLPAIARAGLPLRWNLDLSSPAVREVARLSGWTFGYVVSNQVCLFVLIGLAGYLVSHWTYAYQFFQLPYGVLTVSIMTVFTPELSRLGERGEMALFRERFLQGLRLVLLGLLPATVLGALLARPLIWVVFAQWGGRFTPDNVGPTASTLMSLSWGMVGFSVYLYLLRGFYVLKDTRTPFFVNLFENVVTLGLAFLFTSTAGLGWGVEGLGWAWSGAYFLAALVAFVRLRARTGTFGFEIAVATTATVIRMFTAAGVMLAAVLAVRFLIPGTEGTAAWANLAAGTAAGLVAYVLALLALGVKEIRELPRMVLRR